MCIDCSAGKLENTDLTVSKQVKDCNYKPNLLVCLIIKGGDIGGCLKVEHGEYWFLKCGLG